MATPHGVDAITASGYARPMIAENFVPLALIVGLLVLTYATLLWRKRSRLRWLVVDGSNVMHWRDGKPDLQTIQQVLAALTAQGFTPAIVFDANAGYLLTGRYRHDHAFAKLLGLPTARVFVVPKGTQADQHIIASARRLKARIVTNDRYRDHAADFPEVLLQGHLIKGGYTDGVLWLEPIPAAA